MNTTVSHERGAINGSTIAITALALLVIIFGGFGAWSYMQYTKSSTDVNGQVEDAVAKAIKEQVEADEKKFTEREKQPLRQFAGPDDYGRLTFDYPKTWSAHQGSDISKGGGVTYTAFLHPILVPAITDSQKIAIRISIEQKLYEDVLKGYEKLLKKGDLQSTAWSNGKYSGTLITGQFNKDIRGRAVVLKMRDRTLTIRSDADVFKDDFDAITKTVSFNQ
jgi:hypothetical protein